MNNFLFNLESELLRLKIENKKSEIGRNKESLIVLKNSQVKLLERKNHLERQKSFTYNEKEEVKRIEEALRENERGKKQFVERNIFSDKIVLQCTTARNVLKEVKKIKTSPPPN